MQRQIVLPFSKAVQISLESLRVRLGRSMVTMSGIVLAIAFLMSIWTSNAIIESLREANDPSVNLILQRKGIEIGTEGAKAAQAKQIWLVTLSLLVCGVGITNAMLMSVAERYREIGTMKCLGALDSFIVKLFLLEASFQGLIGTIAGVVIGFLLSFVTALISYGRAPIHYFPVSRILGSMGLSVLIGLALSTLAAVLPATKAAKMEPVEAMRIER
ncbi:MAG: ABC transporter permease [Candidatus Latescibacterota bacterium]|nr:MAG: ABC transporter permease [Candidatus Latescibacterota bacterium]RKY73208.1 MAG: ABC transporter permease [Candidatus Latescibacterota bacterium]HDN67584.1 ABC transporter permease [Bacillota bacterium]